MNKATERGRLFIVPTPIGNLEDITLRAIRILKEVDLVLCEDTRRAAILFQKYGVTTRRESFYDHNARQRTPAVLERLQTGKRIALISEAGTPGVSDPGFYLIRAAVGAELDVEVLPGACAAIVALVASGLPCDRFAFEGFLPAKKGRRTRLQNLKDEPRTLIFYESPHRMQRTLRDLLETLGDRQASYGRELTKLHEEVVRGTLSQLAQRLEERPAKGEFTLIVAGSEYGNRL
ncbi:MAG: 16S rRNA (cytidine(1402)-2'-O)-methyltransferase [bacterium]